MTIESELARTLHQIGSVTLIGTAIAARPRHRRWEHVVPLRRLGFSPGRVARHHHCPLVGNGYGYSWPTVMAADECSAKTPSFDATCQLAPTRVQMTPDRDNSAAPFHPISATGIAHP